MPFWISSAGSYNLLFVMEDPYRTEMNFTSDSPIAFTVSHQYPAIDDNRTNKFRIYITDKEPVSAAKLYRNYVIEQGQFTTLEQKAEANPNIRKLYGAPFIYLWGDFAVSADDIRHFERLFPRRLWNIFCHLPDAWKMVRNLHLS